MRYHEVSGTVVPESLNTRKHIGNNTLNNTVKQTLFIIILAFSETATDYDVIRRVTAMMTS